MEEEKFSRRGFACRLAQVAVSGGLVGLAARVAEGAVIVDLGQEQFAPLRQIGGAVKVVVDGQDFPVIVTRVDEAAFAAFSSECTHWSCEVALPDEKGIVRCPCHTSRFDMQGKLIDGEASGDLYAVELDIRAETAVEGRSWGEIKRSRANEL